MVQSEEAKPVDAVSTPVVNLISVDLLKTRRDDPPRRRPHRHANCRDCGYAVIHPSHGGKIFVATKPVDFCKGHDGLAALLQSHLK